MAARPRPLRVALIGRYAERRWWRTVIREDLAPYGVEVCAAWVASARRGDPWLSRAEAARQRAQNLRDLQAAHVVLYRPSRTPSPGRFVDLGLALAYERPIVVLGAPEWDALPRPDQTIYLRHAIFFATRAELRRWVQWATS